MKHEKALLVLLSYIIGFTTAFIGYGLPTHTTDQSQALAVLGNQKSIVATYVDDTGLFAKTQQGSVIISAEDRTLTTEKDGYHYDIALATVSPNGQFVHYCEQSLEVPTDCEHYVYIADMHEVWPVTHNGVQLISQGNEVRDSWNNDSTLTINGVTSVNSATPWLLE